MDNWVSVGDYSRRYCRSLEAIEKHIDRGYWWDGEHYKFVGSDLYLDPARCEDWFLSIIVNAPLPTSPVKILDRCIMVHDGDSWIEDPGAHNRPYIYFLQCEEYAKIGTSSHPEGRICSIQSGNPFEVHLLALYAAKVHNPVTVEYALHNALADVRVRGEWFRAPIVLDVLDENQRRSRNSDEGKN